MRRRRRHLEVSTFPFLAVLLCTMGSLILLLLVLDRRAKVVAMMKARGDVAAVQANKDRDEEERRQQEAEWERRRQQLHALLAQQEQDLLGQIEDARGQVATAGVKLQNEQTRAEQQKYQLQFVNANLAGLQQNLKAQEESAAQAAQQTDAARRELERQAAALQQLEQTLVSLKLLRERQKNTYSLVPYVGRRGDNRRPIYVECSSGGLIFHPNDVALEGIELTRDRVRAEVEKRIARQPSQPVGQEPQRPYLLMLVRPNGISSYYRAQESLSGMKLDFGYEFIDADWVLDFSAENGDGPPQPWMTAAKLPGQLTVPPGPPPRPVSGSDVIGFPQAPPTGGVGAGGGPGGSGSGQGTGNGGGWPAGAGLPQGGAGGGNSKWPGASGLAPGGGNGGGGPGGQSLVPGFAGGGGSNGLPGIPQFGVGASSSAGTGKPQGVASGSGSGDGQGPSPAGGNTGGSWQPGGPVANGTGGAGTSGGSATLPSGAMAKGAIGDSGKAGQPGNAAAGNGQGGSGGAQKNTAGGQGVSGGVQNGQAGSGSQDAANNSGGNQAPGNSSVMPKMPGNAGSAKGTPGEPGGSMPGGGGGEGGGSGGSALLGSPATAGTKASPVGPPLGRILSNRDWPIYIECTATGVTVKQGGEKFTIDALAAPTRGEHPLAQTIRQMIARRQATVRTGEPPYRPMLRFQVRPDGMRAYYLAYPLLDGLRLPMARENLEANK